MPPDTENGLETQEALEINRELDRVLASVEFQGLDTARRLLHYIVGEALAGRKKNLNVSVIAKVVFHRDNSYPEEDDPFVRIETNRTRRALQRYYAGADRNSRIRISIVKDGYVPMFLRPLVGERAVETNPFGRPTLQEQSQETSQSPEDKPLTLGDMALPIGVPLALIAIILLTILKPVRLLLF